MRRYSYTERFVHREFFARRRLYTRRLLCKEVFTQKFLRTDALHKDAFARTKKTHTQALSHTELLHREAFAQNNFWTKTLTQKIVHTDCTKKFLHTETFTRRNFTQNSFYTQNFSAQKPLRTEVFMHNSFYTDAFAHRCLYTEKLFHSFASPSWSPTFRVSPSEVCVWSLQQTDCARALHYMLL